MRQITGRDGLRKCLVTPTRVVEKLKGLWGRQVHGCVEVEVCGCGLEFGREKLSAFGPNLRSDSFTPMVYSQTC
jgi:hypothetical protein